MNTKTRMGLVLCVGFALGLAVQHMRAVPTSPEVRVEQCEPSASVSSVSPTVARPVASAAVAEQPRRSGSRYETIRRTLAEERRRNNKLQHQLEELQASLARSQFQKSLEADPRNYGFTQDELLALVDRCEVRNDIPSAVSEQDAEELGMTAAEVVAYNKALSRSLAKHASRKAKIWAAATGTDVSEMPDDPLKLRERLGSNPEDRWLHRDIARERAGLVEQPDDRHNMSGLAAWTRAEASLGYMMMAELAKDLGAKRADEIRRAKGGWPGGSTRSSGCPKE